MRFTLQSVSRLGQWWLALVLLVAFAMAPDGADPTFIWPCLLIFYAYFYAAIRKPTTLVPGVPTYVTIETLFLTFYYLIFYYAYQLELLGAADITVSRFNISTFPLEANRAVLLATLGLVTFWLGIRRSRPQTMQHSSASRLADEHYSMLPLFVLILQAAAIAAYIGAGWRSAGEGRYTNSVEGGILANGMANVIIMLCMTSLAVLVWHIYRRVRVPLSAWLSVALSAFWCLRLLSFGDRNSFLLIAVVGFAGLATFRFRVGRVMMGVGILVGLLFYNAIEVVRMTGTVTPETLFEAINTGGDNARDAQGAENSFNITTITVRAAIATVPQQFPFALGYYKIAGLAGVVPFLGGLIVGGIGGSFTASAELLGYVIIGPNASWNPGSNVLSDLYVDFGVLGVAVGMFVLGFLGRLTTGYLERRPASPFRMSLYLAVVSLYAETPRYAVDFPLRFVAWLSLVFLVYHLMLRPPVSRQTMGEGAGLAAAMPDGSRQKSA